MYMSNPCSLFSLCNIDLFWVSTSSVPKGEGRGGGDGEPHPKFLTGSSIDRTP